MHVPLTDVFGWWPFREGSAADRPPVAGSRLLLEESARVPTCSSAKGLFLNISIRHGKSQTTLACHTQTTASGYSTKRFYTCKGSVLGDSGILFAGLSPDPQPRSQENVVST